MVKVLVIVRVLVVAIVTVLVIAIQGVSQVLYGDSLSGSGLGVRDAG